MKQEDFLTIISKLKELANDQDNVLEVSDVRNALSGVDLSDKDMEAVYSYLAENHISIVGISYDTADENINLTEDDDRYLKMYLEELNELPEISRADLIESIIQVKNGKKDYAQTIINANLKNVVDIAKTYVEHGMLLEDLIQEGNMGLLLGASSIPKDMAIDDVSDYLKEAIKLSITEALDADTEASTLEETVVAKVSLITEAATLLENQLGHAPSIAELADYTKLSYDEVNDILGLSKSN